MQAVHHKGKTREEVINDYDGFMEKFKPKLTTDDCMTPEPVYEAVAFYVTERYGIERERMVRPFWPGFDYTAMNYPAGCVVVDNPPFSILTQIVKYYREQEVDFFMFAPALTAMNVAKVPGVTIVYAHANIYYENGACVRTAFVTSLDPERVAVGDPTFAERLEEAAKRAERGRKAVVPLPVYAYPDAVVTGPLIDKWTGHGVPFEVRREDAVFVRRMDSQVAHKKNGVWRRASPVGAGVGCTSRGGKGGGGQGGGRTGGGGQSAGHCLGAFRKRASNL